MDEQRRLNFYPSKITIPDQRSTETTLIYTHMKKFLAAVRGKGLGGKGLGVSLLMDPSTRYWGENTQPAPLPPELPSEGQLECTIDRFT